MKQINFFTKLVTIDGFTLKMIAVIAMLIDHIGLIFFPDIIALRVIGRLALPIFAFLLTEGLLKTSNVNNYIIRLFAFALISQIPFSLVLYITGNYILMLNIFFLLGVGLGALVLAQKQKNIFVQILIIGAASLVATIANVDYSAYGIWMIASFYILQRNTILGAALFAIFTILECLLLPYPMGLIQIFAIAALPLILSYNGQPGLRISRWWFYWFYPAHMLFLTALYFLLQKL